MDDDGPASSLDFQRGLVNHVQQGSANRSASCCACLVGMSHDPR